LGKGMLTDVDSVVQDGDIVHVVLTQDRREQASTVLAQGPEAH